MAVPDLTRERVGVPVARVGGHDIGMVQKNETGLRAPFQPGPEIPAAGSRLGRFVRDALGLQELRKEGNRPGLVAGGIRRIDTQVRLQALHGLGFERLREAGRG